MKIDGAAIIVTGSATGVGAACVKQFAEGGARVVINYSRSKKRPMRPAISAAVWARRSRSSKPTLPTTRLAAGWSRLPSIDGDGSTPW